MTLTRLRHLLWGTAFVQKIERLEMAFASASAPFNAEIKLVKREAEVYQKEINVGEATWEQINNVDDSYKEKLTERRKDALDALFTLRKAFIFLVYHQWERLMQHWVKPGESPNYEKLMKAAKIAGIPLNEAGLEVLRLLVNTLKHNSTKSGLELYKIRPDLFESYFDPNGINPATSRPYNIIEWADHVYLTDKNVGEFIEIVRESSPGHFQQLTKRRSEAK